LFGTDEFMDWCQFMSVEPYLCLNMGTGTLDEALAWLEYCNSDSNTYYANLRWLMVSRLILFNAEERVIGDPLIALLSYGLVPELVLALRNNKARTMREEGGGFAYLRVNNFSFVRKSSSWRNPPLGSPGGSSKDLAAPPDPPEQVQGPEAFVWTVLLCQLRRKSIT
jgi:hypothetical protein